MKVSQWSRRFKHSCLLKVSAQMMVKSPEEVVTFNEYSLHVESLRVVLISRNRAFLFGVFH